MIINSHTGNWGYLCNYRKRKAKFPLLEKKLLELVVELRGKGMLISQVLIREKARVLIKEIYPEASFLASSGWCTKFMRRNGLSHRKVTR